MFSLVDDMGRQETSEPVHNELTAPNRRYQPPDMESLAREGMKFTSTYASAFCSPTKANTLTQTGRRVPPGDELDAS